ncbi:MAG: epoxyqueuosine reductase QueH [Planctomycetota bacterium]
MQRLLLHICCAPCATSPHRRLTAEGWETVLFFFNPNLYPESEHTLRLAEAKRYAGEAGMAIQAPEPDFMGWRKAVRDLEEEPEGGVRCEACIAFRLDRTTRAAKEGAFDAFATTLSVSPHKRTALIDEAGEACAARHGVSYLAADFKKGGGFQESVRLAREHGLYRQNYCGCEYSIRKESV